MRIYIMFIWCLIFTDLNAQFENDTAKGMEHFNRGIDFFNENKLDSAVYEFEYIVNNNIAKNYDVYGSSFFNIPTIYWRMEKYESAKEWYLKILNSDLKDNVETGSLMEPHANYKHKSAISLARLNLIDSNYNQAYHWINLADTVYRYWGFEGSATSVSSNQAYILSFKTGVLLKLKKENEAIKNIVEELICADHLETFFSKSKEKLIELTKSTNYKEKFNEAIEQLIIKDLDSNNWIATFKIDDLEYIIPISNNYPGDEFPHYWRIIFINEKSSPNRNQIIKHIKKQNFYYLFKN